LVRNTAKPVRGRIIPHTAKNAKAERKNATSPTG